ncbi:putative membrane protein [Teratosphaeria destructans]|uniref:Membrane protein n=1 Tax=Teratosphaeria destructans TaxID=418781 RepID=A0A9W7W604_9PEZI|nr:putative membrane protein [Teratosphaeria destructans]
MSLVRWAITRIAPIFIVTSPVTSYADQIWSINKTRSAAGFSLDIPLIMLVASILKVFYWLGARYDFPLLIQASVMCVVQVLLLHVALLHRPPFGAQHSLNKPFVGAQESDQLVTRPYNFWQWRSRKPYWHFLGYYTAVLATLQYLIGRNASYIAIQGYVALGVEAILPIPQILQNHRSRSCKGFRLSVLVNWIIGDVFKMTYFFLSEGGVPWAFKLCGLFQAGCDAYLGVQYWMYGEGASSPLEAAEKDPRLA